ncbi:MAG: hypothetical protein MPJ22_08485 [Pirellulales bacterium]|nr:hypothetical protein [Alphaproteobacteria bacterium]MDA8031530.1 hypothetical protein [Alphaproteobacteria bacterium]MDA8042438.1 hypothetical protein [Pirellulales bacterium]
MSKYPFEQSWPSDGFAMDEAQHVQIRAIGPICQASPPVKGYPSVDSRTRAYEWWEVHIFFMHKREHSRADGHHIQIKNKAGRILKAIDVSQCIARFQTKEDAYRFVHHMHQSKSKKHFFPSLD